MQHTYGLSIARNDGFPFARNHTSQPDPIEVFSDAATACDRIARLQAAWIVSSANDVVKGRIGRGVFNFALHADDVERVRDRFSDMGWRYNMSTGWCDEGGYDKKTTSHPLVGRYCVCRATTAQEDARADREEHHGARDRAWRRAGL